VNKTLKPSLIFILIFVACYPALCQKEDFNILNKWIKWNNYGGMLISHFNDQAFNYLDIRKMRLPG